MPKKINEYSLIPLLNEYIRSVKKGKILHSSGKKLSAGSVENYKFLLNLLQLFETKKQFDLRIRVIGDSKTKFEAEKKYWRNFYIKFTNFLYDDLNHYDNYVCAISKLMKAFFNYLKTEKGLNIGDFHKKFKAPKEEIEIVILNPERLNYLITSKEFEKTLNTELKKVKDIFVLGCTVGLRYSDLIHLKPGNLEYIGSNVYLKVNSKKTQTLTRIKLPEYAKEILGNYSQSPKGILPYYNKATLNKKIKELIELAGWTEPTLKTRSKRGLPILQYKNPKAKTLYRFCDLVTTHTMRRTAITTMLSFGMNEQAVRKISGHAAGSKEFYRYVSLAQTFMDNELDTVHQKLVNI